MKILKILILMISFSALANNEIVGLNIKEADIQVQNQGWRPLPLKCEYEEEQQSYWFANDSENIYKSGITSIHHCSGTGQNYCGFFYEKLRFVNRKLNKRCLKLVTSGEFSYKGLDSLIVEGVSDHCPEEC